MDRDDHLLSSLSAGVSKPIIDQNRPGRIDESNDHRVPVQVAPSPFTSRFLMGTSRRSLLLRNPRYSAGVMCRHDGTAPGTPRLPTCSSQRLFFHRVPGLDSSIDRYMLCHEHRSHANLAEPACPHKAGASGRKLFYSISSKIILEQVIPASALRSSDMSTVFT